MLDAIQDKLGIVDHEDSELADLEMETKPEDVLDLLQKSPGFCRGGSYAAERRAWEPVPQKFSS